MPSNASECFEFAEIAFDFLGQLFAKRMFVREVQFDAIGQRTFR